MPDELPEIVAGHPDEGGRGDGPAQRGGIRGLLSRIFRAGDGDDPRAPVEPGCCSRQLLDDDDDDGRTARRQGCCAGDGEAGDATRSGQTSARATRQRDQDQRDRDFDVGD